jgi:hypothetical protein
MSMMDVGSTMPNPSIRAGIGGCASLIHPTELGMMGRQEMGILP